MKPKLQVESRDDDLIIIGPAHPHTFHIAQFYNNDGCGQVRAEEVVHVWNTYPDLLAACEALLAADTARMEGRYRPRYEAIRQANAAIAKAKGE